MNNREKIEDVLPIMCSAMIYSLTPHTQDRSFNVRMTSSSVSLQSPAVLYLPVLFIHAHSEYINFSHSSVPICLVLFYNPYEVDVPLCLFLL